MQVVLAPSLFRVISVRLEGLGLHSLGALLDGMAQRCGGGWQGLRPAELAWGDSGNRGTCNTTWRWGQAFSCGFLSLVAEEIGEAKNESRGPKTGWEGPCREQLEALLHKVWDLV